MEFAKLYLIKNLNAFAHLTMLVKDVNTVSSMLLFFDEFIFNLNKLYKGICDMDTANNEEINENMNKTSLEFRDAILSKKTKLIDLISSFNISSSFKNLKKNY